MNLSLGDDDGTRLDPQVSDCPGTGETRTFLFLDRWEVQVGTAGGGLEQGLEGFRSGFLSLLELHIRPAASSPTRTWLV